MVKAKNVQENLNAEKESENRHKIYERIQNLSIELQKLSEEQLISVFNKKNIEKLNENSNIEKSKIDFDIDSCMENIVKNNESLLGISNADKNDKTLTKNVEEINELEDLIQTYKLENSLAHYLSQKSIIRKELEKVRTDLDNIRILKGRIFKSRYSSHNKTEQSAFDNTETCSRLVEYDKTKQQVVLGLSPSKKLEVLNSTSKSCSKFADLLHDTVTENRTIFRRVDKAIGRIQIGLDHKIIQPDYKAFQNAKFVRTYDQLLQYAKYNEKCDLQAYYKYNAEDLETLQLDKKSNFSYINKNLIEADIGDWLLKNSRVDEIDGVEIDDGKKKNKVSDSIDRKKFVKKRSFKSLDHNSTSESLKNDKKVDIPFELTFVSHIEPIEVQEVYTPKWSKLPEDKLKTIVNLKNKLSNSVLVKSKSENLLPNTHSDRLDCHTSNSKEVSSVCYINGSQSGLQNVESQCLKLQNVESKNCLVETSEITDDEEYISRHEKFEILERKKMQEAKEKKAQEEAEKKMAEQTTSTTSNNVNEESNLFSSLETDYKSVDLDVYSEDTGQ